MDIGTVLDTTMPVPFKFMDHDVTLHVYTAGWTRLTQEQRDEIEVAEEKARAIEGEAQTAEGDLSAVGYNRVVIRARAQLPMMLSGWDFDGSPMERNGKPFPPTAENVTSTPDALLVASYGSAYKAWAGEDFPTNGVEQVSGSQPAENATEQTAS